MKASHKKMIVLTAYEALNMFVDVLATVESLVPRRRVYEYLEQRSFDRARFRKTLHYLIERGYLHDVVTSKEHYLEVTDEGQRKLASRRPSDILPIPGHWDRRWRIVIFDIPAKWQKSRNYFREHLKGWGFFPLQRSIYVYPFDCHSQLNALIDYHKIDGCVQYLIAEILQGEENVLNHFVDEGILSKVQITGKRKTR